jgi:hypothetical protein
MTRLADFSSFLSLVDFEEFDGRATRNFRRYRCTPVFRLSTYSIYVLTPLRLHMAYDINSIVLKVDVHGVIKAAYCVLVRENPGLAKQ